MKYDPYTGNPIEEPEQTTIHDETANNTSSDSTPTAESNSMYSSFEDTTNPQASQSVQSNSTDSMYHNTAPTNTSDWNATSGSSTAQSQTQYDPYTGQPINNAASYQSNNINPDAIRKDTTAKNLGIASLILGIVAIVSNLLWFCCCPFLTLISGIVAIILGCLAKDSQGNRSSLARAGIITGIIGLVICVIITVAFLLLAMSGESDFWDAFKQEFQDEFRQDYDNGNSTYDYFNMIKGFLLH